MKIFIVYYHPEPQSFNGALLATAISTLEGAGHEVKISNLHEMNFNPTSGRHNFNTVKDPDFFKQQIEELHATEVQGFSINIEAELMKVEWCELVIWQFSLWWFGLSASKYFLPILPGALPISLKMNAPPYSSNIKTG